MMEPLTFCWHHGTTTTSQCQCFSPSAFIITFSHQALRSIQCQSLASIKVEKSFSYQSSQIAPGTIGDKISQKTLNIEILKISIFTRNPSWKLTLNRKLKVGSLRQNVLPKFCLYRQFCFEHKFSLCRHCRPEEKTFNNFSMWAVWAENFVFFSNLLQSDHNGY